MLAPPADNPPDALVQLQKQLSIILAMDHIRDNGDDEIAILGNATSLILQELEAEVCLLSWWDPDTQRFETRALHDRINVMSQLAEEDVRRLIQTVSAFVEPQPVAGEQLPATIRQLYWIGSAIQIKGEVLGVLLLANLERPFNAAELALLNAGISQLDSTMLHLRALNDLRRERQELQTLYTVDRIRDQGLPFDEMLNAVLAELCRAIPCEAGFIMLYDVSGQQLELRAATDRDLLAISEHYELALNAANEALHSAKPVRRSPSQNAIRALICLPLILNTRIIGVLGVMNRVGREDFTRVDRRLLYAISSQIDTAIFEGLQIQRYREAFGRRVGAKVMERMLAMPERDWLKGERVTVTALFSDIRGFTATSEVIEPELLVQILSDHLSAMTEAVRAYDGTLDKFIGDGVMALYNVPLPQPDHVLRAVQTALAMRAAHRQVMERWPQLPPIGLGIDTGEVIVGNFGSTQRLEYTAIGRHINLAARLCGAAEGDQILISASAYALVRDQVHAEPIAALRLKGISEAVETYQVLGLK
jgi:class 3 adenylate cyclase